MNAPDLKTCATGPAPLCPSLPTLLATLSRPPMPPRRSASPAWRRLCLTGLACAISPLWVACSKPQAAEEAPPAKPTMSGETVSFPGDLDPPALRFVNVAQPGDHAVQLPGRLAWDDDHTARVYAPYAGRIERLLVAAGQRVQRGQALVLLSSADIGQAQADLHKAQVDAGLARSAGVRVRDLVEGGVLARKELDQADADQARSAAELARARARLALYGVSADAVTQSVTLKSPLDGVIVERNGNAGGEVRSDVQGAALFTITDPRSLWAMIDVDETQLALLQTGQQLMLATAAWPDQRFAATVTSVGASVDPASRTVKVRARVANPDGRLKAEMFVTASVSVGGGLPMVPADAVYLRGDKAAVFVHKGPGQFERRQVQVRSAGAAQWLVASGLVAGEQVVAGGALYLNQLLDGAK